VAFLRSADDGSARGLTPGAPHTIAFSFFEFLLKD